MGNTESANKRKRQKALLKQMEEDSQKTAPLYTKRILLLHKSNAVQLRVVENFLDAFITKTEGTVDVPNVVNIADETKIPKSLEWLDEKNNIVLICLTAESIESFKKIVADKGFADQNGHLHSKVFTVSFGGNVTSKWPPVGMKSGSKNLRDFHFGFSNVENLRPRDFMNSLRLNSLIAAIKGADIKDLFQET